MGKPAAIVRLLQRAKPAAVSAPPDGNESAEPQHDAEVASRVEADESQLPVEAADDDSDLEAGIASVFAAIRSGAASGEPREDLPEDSGATYALLSMLDQLWHNA